MVKVQDKFSGETFTHFSEQDEWRIDPTGEGMTVQARKHGETEWHTVASTRTLEGAHDACENSRRMHTYYLRADAQGKLRDKVIIER